MPCCFPCGKAAGLQILCCQGFAVSEYRFTLGALALKPSDFCNLKVKLSISTVLFAKNIALYYKNCMPTKRVGDINLYYEMAGEGPPLVFVHGLGSSSRDWAFQVDCFAAEYRVITVDVRGHGKSDKPPGPYSVPMFAADIAGLLKALQIPAVHVVGLSMGGMIAFQLAVDTPQLLKSMTIVNIGPQLIARTAKEKIQFFIRTMIPRMLGMRKMGQVLARRLFPRPEQEAIRRDFIERWAENDKNAYLASWKALVGWSVAAHLGKMNIPALVIAADQDYTPVEHKKAWVAQMPRAELVVIADSHHATPVDQPDKFNQALARFLERWAKNPR